MYFLDLNVCTMQDTAPVWNIVGFVIDTVWIGIPILLIILGMIDLGKAVISSKEDEIKKSTKTLGRRFIYAVAVFAVVWLVQLLMNFIGKLDLDQINSSSIDSWKVCWCRIKDNCNSKIISDMYGEDQGSWCGKSEAEQYRDDKGAGCP